MDDIGSNEFEIEGVRLSLRPGDGGASIVSADLGPLAEDDAEALAGEMLEANFLYQGTGGATLAVDPRNGHLYLQKYNWLDRLDVEKAVTGLTRFADMVKLWKGLVAETTAHAPVASDVLSAPTPGAFMQV